MTPADAIGALDRQLAAHGQKVTVVRYTAPSGNPRPTVELVDINAFVRAVGSEDIAGDIKATSSKVTLSPTDIASFWPLLDSDKIKIAGKVRAVQLVKPVMLANVLVRCNLMVSG